MSFRVQFNVLTYNVFAFPKIIENVAQNTRLALIIKKIADSDPNTSIDVVSFNELWDDSEREYVIKGMRDIGFDYDSGILPRHPFKLLNGGVQIFSKWPISTTDWITYTNCAYEDCLASKGGLYTRIIKTYNGGEYAFNVIGTHLNVGSTGKTQQLSQIAELKQLINKWTARQSAKEPFVILGDLNVNKFTNPEHYEKMLSILGFCDYTDIKFSTQSTNTARRKPATSSENKTTGLLDYIIWDKGTTVQGTCKNLYQEFKLSVPLYDIPYCPGEIGKGYIYVDCDSNDRYIYDLSDHDPILGQFIVSFEYNEVKKIDGKDARDVSLETLHIIGTWIPTLLISYLIYKLVKKMYSFVLK